MIRRSRNAFTLIEVTAALGIAVAGILLLMALVPTGLSQLNEASKTATGRSIVNGIVAELMLHPWAELDRFDASEAGIRFFDEQGVELDPADREDALFRVRVRVENRDLVLDHSAPIPSKTEFRLPGEPTFLPDGTLSHLRRVHIDLVASPSPAFDTAAGFGTADALATGVETHTALLSNLGDAEAPARP